MVISIIDECLCFSYHIVLACFLCRRRTVFTRPSRPTCADQSEFSPCSTASQQVSTQTSCSSPYPSHPTEETGFWLLVYVISFLRSLPKAHDCNDHYQSDELVMLSVPAWLPLHQQSGRTPPLLLRPQQITLPISRSIFLSLGGIHRFTKQILK